MPELPEVESVVRTLRPRLVGARIVSFKASGYSLREPIDQRALKRACLDHKVLAVKRRGKFILIELSSEKTLLAHLGMSGVMCFAPPDDKAPKHTHARFGLGATELRFIDPRRFGLLTIFDTGEMPVQLAELGPDPLEPDFTVEYLQAALRKSKRDIKALLMDQHCIAGLGNIYVCEALFLAQISPRRRTGKLDAAALHQSVRKVIETAIANRGTSFSDYVDAEGEAGDNQDFLMVYGREKELCRQCKSGRIRRLVQGGRSSFYCPTCQY